MTVTHTQPAPTFDDVWRVASRFMRCTPVPWPSAVAAMVMSDAVRDYALAHGLFVLRQSGDRIEISNPEGFTPAVW